MPQNPSSHTSHKTKIIFLSLSLFSLGFCALTTNSTSQTTNNTLQITNNKQQIINNSPIDYQRLIKMSKLLKSSKTKAYEEYKNLCLLAKDKPQIGMTIDQSRNSTWCFLYERHVTTTQNGIYVQEIYLKRNSLGESDSRYSPRQYLYFTNNILTAIQE